GADRGDVHRAAGHRAAGRRAGGAGGGLLRPGWAFAAGDPAGVAGARGVRGGTAAAGGLRDADRRGPGRPDRVLRGAAPRSPRAHRARREATARAAAAVVLRAAAALVPGADRARCRVPASAGGARLHWAPRPGGARREPRRDPAPSRGAAHALHPLRETAAPDPAPAGRARRGPPRALHRPERPPGDGAGGRGLPLDRRGGRPPLRSRARSPAPSRPAAPPPGEPPAAPDRPSHRRRRVVARPAHPRAWGALRGVRRGPAVAPARALRPIRRLRSLAAPASAGRPPGGAAALLARASDAPSSRPGAPHGPPAAAGPEPA